LSLRNRHRSFRTLNGSRRIVALQAEFESKLRNRVFTSYNQGLKPGAFKLEPGAFKLWVN
jgi:hypothetical protein